MLSESEKVIKDPDSGLNPSASVYLFGQEYDPESYAICGSDLTIKGEDVTNIAFGDTLGTGKTKDGFVDGDGHPNEHFHYMLANPPFGVEWKPEKDQVTKEHNEFGFNGRFGPGLPRINDGALLFLLHMISKMEKSPTEAKGGEGSRIAVVFNGSPLFTGDAGSGESNIRRWIIENDMLEAVVGLPDQLFYNTGIYTYPQSETREAQRGREVNYLGYPQYQESKAVWLGRIPSHWKVHRLKWSVTGCSNGVWGAEPDGVDDVVCVRVADFNRETLTVGIDSLTNRAVEPNQLETRKLQRGDLLLEKSGGGEKQLVGCVVYFDHDFDAVCSNFVARMPVEPTLSARYWCYVHAGLYAGKLNYPAIKQSTGIQNLDANEYLNTLAAYPPADEQTQIAAFLDWKQAKLTR